MIYITSTSNSKLQQSERLWLSFHRWTASLPLPIEGGVWRLENTYRSIKFDFLESTNKSPKINQTHIMFL